MDNLITATQYAQAHGLSDRTVRHKAQTGQFKTATKKGKTWYIDKAEPFPEVDGRRTTGAYVDWRQKHSRRVPELQDPRPESNYKTLGVNSNYKTLDPSGTTEPCWGCEVCELQNPPGTTEPLRNYRTLDDPRTTEPS